MSRLVGLALVKAERALAGRRAVVLALAEAEQTELRPWAPRAVDDARWSSRGMAAASGPLMSTVRPV